MSLLPRPLRVLLPAALALSVVGAPLSTASCRPVLVDPVGDNGVGLSGALPPQEPSGTTDLVAVDVHSGRPAVTVVVHVAKAARSPYDHLWTVSFLAHEQRWAAVLLETSVPRWTIGVRLERAATPGGQAGPGPGAAQYETVGTGTGTVDEVRNEVVMRFPSSMFGPSGLGSRISDPLAVADLGQPGSAALSAAYTDVDEAQASGSFRTGC